MTATDWIRGETLYADALDMAFGRCIDRGGDTMAGTLVLARDPVFQMEAVTKQYLDNRIVGAPPPSEISVSIGDNPPIGAVSGALWWNSTDGQLYVYYTDADSSQWVVTQAGSSGGGGGGSDSIVLVPSPPSTQLNTPAQSIFVGYGAGASYPYGAETYGSVAIGPAALSKMTSVGSENVAVGAWAAQFATAGLMTVVGMHALGAADDGLGITAIGNDVARDAFPGHYATGIGQSALAHGAPDVGVVAVGSQSMRGMSAAIIITGTATAGNTITLGITSSVFGLTGLPVSKVYTVGAGSSLATIASGIASLLDNTVHGQSYDLQAFAGTLPDGSALVRFNFPGTATVGWRLAITATTSGGATVACQVIAGSTPSGSVAIGASAMAGPAMQGAINDTFIGDSAGANITTGQYNVGVGWHSANSLMSGGANAIVGAFAMPAATTAGDNSAVGFWTLKNLTTGTNNTVVGSRSGQALTTGSYNLILGPNTAQNTLTTGSNNILIQSGNRALDAPTSGTSNYINIENVLSVVGTNAPATSVAKLEGNLIVNGGQIGSGATGNTPLVFKATPTGTNVPVEGMRLTPDLTLLVGTTTEALGTVNLEVVGGAHIDQIYFGNILPAFGEPASIMMGDPGKMNARATVFSLTRDPVNWTTGAVSLYVNANASQGNSITQAGDHVISAYGDGATIDKGGLVINGWNSVPFGIRLDNAAHTITLTGSVQTVGALTLSAHSTATTTWANLNVISTAVGSGTNGPATTQSAANFDLRKDGWDTLGTAAATGELDVLTLFGRQAGTMSDIGGLLINVQHRGSGFAAAHEYNVSYFDQPSGFITQFIDTQEAICNGGTNTAYGHVYSAEVGNFTTGILIQTNPLNASTFTGSISGTTLTATGVGSYGIAVGHTLSGTGVTAGTTIVSQLSGAANRDGTYTVSVSQTVASTAMATTYPAATWTNYMQCSQGGITHYTLEGTGRITTSGGLNVVGTGLIRTVGASSATSAPGAYLMWNKDSGGGGTWLLNQKGSGNGGFIFGEVDTSGVVTQRVSVAGPTGNVTINNGLAVNGAASTGGALTVGVPGTNNALTITPGAAPSSSTPITLSGSGNLQLFANTVAFVAPTVGNNLVVTPGASVSSASITVGTSGTGVINFTGAGGMNIGPGGANAINVLGGTSTSTAALITNVNASGGMQLGNGGNKLAFLGGTPIAKPTITGAKGSNAALASLLAALVNYGLVTDSTTA